MTDNRTKGMAGESIACWFLKQQGYTIIERNFFTKSGEIDIIAKDGAVLVFVEVKYRKNTSFGYPGEAVDVKKQRKIYQAAKVYIGQKGFSFDQPMRFDVVEILGKKIRVIKNAF